MNELTTNNFDNQKNQNMSDKNQTEAEWWKQIENAWNGDLYLRCGQNNHD